MGFQKDSYKVIQRLKIECRKTKTKVITLTNHSKRKERQSYHGENVFKPVTNLNSREKSATFISSLMQGMIKKNQNGRKLV